MKTKIAMIAMVCLFTACEPIEGSAKDTTTTLKIRSLQRDYTETAKRINSDREHLLRLEGAILILQELQDDVSTETQTLED